MIGVLHGLREYGLLDSQHCLLMPFQFWEENRDFFHVAKKKCVGEESIPKDEPANYCQLFSQGFQVALTVNNGSLDTSIRRINVLNFLASSDTRKLNGLPHLLFFYDRKLQ